MNFLHFMAKKNYGAIQMIEYFRLKIEDLSFAFGIRPLGVCRAYAPVGGSTKKDLYQNARAERFP
jgi:hypothetical protein